MREFWLFDPIGRLPRPVNGWRLDADGTYAPVPALPDGGCRSAVLDLDLVAYERPIAGPALRIRYAPGSPPAQPHRPVRFRDPATGALLPDHAETAAALGAAETARQREASARQAAEARVAELEALLRRRS